MQPLRRAVELIPVDGNGTGHFVRASHILTSTLVFDGGVGKMEEALEICDNALERNPTYTPLFVTRYYCATVLYVVRYLLTHTTV